MAHRQGLDEVVDNRQRDHRPNPKSDGTYPRRTVAEVDHDRDPHERGAAERQQSRCRRQQGKEGPIWNPAHQVAKAKRDAIEHCGQHQPAHHGRQCSAERIENDALDRKSVV